MTKYYKHSFSFMTWPTGATATDILDFSGVSVWRFSVGLNPSFLTVTSTNTHAHVRDSNPGPL